MSAGHGATAARGYLLLTLALAAASACALVVEIVAGRMLAPYVGMSLYTWTSIIAVLLAGLSLGHWLGGVLDPGERRGSLERVALALAAVTTLAVPWLVRGVSAPLLANGCSPSRCWP